MDLTEARAAWMAANPFPIIISEDGEDRPTTQDEYTAMADNRAQIWLDRHTRDDAEAAETVLRDKAKGRYAALKAGTATSAQVQDVVAWLLRQQIQELAP